MLIGLPVFHHLGVDTKTLRESLRDLVDGTNCADIDTRNLRGKSSRVGRLTIARLNHVTHEEIDEKHTAMDKNHMERPKILL